MLNLLEILNTTQEELATLVLGEIDGLHRDSVVGEKYIYSPGSVPVLLIAHLDTVHKTPPSVICSSPDGRVLMSPFGIGGDDRCGVYALLSIAQQSDCHLLFTYDEETGCRGAADFCKSEIMPEVNYCIEIDRKGDNDSVFYDCDNTKFEEFINTTGNFETAIGSCSDISSIAPYIGVAAVNISSGYYNPHTQGEYIDVWMLEYNIKRVIDIINSEVSEPFQYIKKEKVISTYKWSGDKYGCGWDGWGNYDGTYSKKLSGKTPSSDDSDDDDGITQPDDNDDYDDDFVEEFLQSVTELVEVFKTPHNSTIELLNGDIIDGEGLYIDADGVIYRYEPKEKVYVYDYESSYAEHISTEKGRDWNPTKKSWFVADCVYVDDYDEYKFYAACTK